MTDKTMNYTKEDEVTLWSLFWSYLKIGSTAFGGFMALISVIQNLLVEKKKLLSHDEMLDGISLASILPGPIAVNVATYTGYKIRGIPGAIVCFSAVILPSFFLVLGLSYAYFTFGNIPSVSHIFMGFIPAVAAIIIVSAVNLGKKSLIGISHYSIALISMLLLIFIGGIYTTISIILLSGLFGFLLYRNNNDPDKNSIKNVSSKTEIKKISALLVLILLSIPALLTAIIKFQTILSIKLLTVFSGMSLMLFGGGFVFIPMMQEVVVDTYGWLSHSEFIDGIALGQVTPGPIVISATFIGYKVAGILGATSATVGAFVPPAIVMVICTSYLDKIKNSIIIQPVLKGIRCGVIGMIAAAGYVVISTAEQNIISLLILTTTLIMLIKFRIDVALLIPLSGLVGYLYYL